MNVKLLWQLVSHLPAWIYACLYICALLVFCNTAQSHRKVFRNGQAMSD